VALAAPKADPQLLGAVTLPGAALPSNCAIEYEEIETSKCTPRANRVCDTKELRQEGVKYERVCKDIVNKVCHPGHFLAKREAEPEADAQFLGYHGAPLVAAAAHAVPAAVTATIKTECSEVTEQHCVDNPVAVENTVPVERCHVETVVECEPVVNKIPKTICEPVETTVVHHAAGLFHL